VKVSAASTPVAASALPVGGPCKRTDGWQQPEFSNVQPSGSAALAVVGASQLAAIALKDFHELPTRTGYCIAPSEVYPNGYFTMNCASDSDCLGGSFCEGVGQCRRQCSGDVDCGSGMSCSGSPKAFCQGTLKTRSVTR
jgi:hypothetical protein